MLIEAAIGIAILLVFVYFVLPYRQAHLRRKQLEQKIREGRKQGAMREDAV